MRAAMKVTGTVAALGAACIVWGLSEAHAFTVRRCKLAVLPVGSPDIKVLHLADLHLLERQHDKVRFLRKLAELGPDLVINTGDNIASDAAVHTLSIALRGLRGIPGVFVFGSNDYQAPVFKNPFAYLRRGRSFASPDTQVRELPTGLLRTKLEELGWVDLTHRRHMLRLGGLSVEFRGTDDAHHDRDDYATVAGPPSPGIDLSVGVTHAPYLRLLDQLATDGCDVTFAGHTHGGQVCIPGWGALVTNCDLEPARVKGPSTHETAGATMALHVSAGLGTSPFAPFRFSCRPEVNLVTLTTRS